MAGNLHSCTREPLFGHKKFQPVRKGAPATSGYQEHQLPQKVLLRWPSHGTKSKHHPVSRTPGISAGSAKSICSCRFLLQPRERLSIMIPQKKILQQDEQPQQEQPRQKAQSSIILAPGIRERKKTDPGEETPENEDTITQEKHLHRSGTDARSSDYINGIKYRDRE